MLDLTCEAVEYLARYYPGLLTSCSAAANDAQNPDLLSQPGCEFAPVIIWSKAQSVIQTAAVRRLLIYAAIALLARVAVADDDGWTLVRSNDGIDTFVNEQRDDGFREFRGVTTMAATFEEARDVIKDIPGNVHWLPSCRRAELVRYISETELLVYMVSRAPWPITDRDCVWKRIYAVDTDDHFLMKFIADHAEFEGEEGLVRILKGRGVWEVKRFDATTSTVSFQYIGDGGGNVPRGFVNTSTRSIPEKTLRALHQRILALRAN